MQRVSMTALATVDDSNNNNNDDDDWLPLSSRCAVTDSKQSHRNSYNRGSIIHHYYYNHLLSLLLLDVRYIRRVNRMTKALPTTIDSFETSIHIEVDLCRGAAAIIEASAD